ncbi:hypothetical protein [[Clostridium] dakarense]|uniref:hypothetical protein n=1 Tax=Faecalimicrobium dakarense TaxID=1301100 RepID=UPI001FA78B96|nr:hypothetical protein [[Clostridium] dakarense]
MPDYILESSETKNQCLKMLEEKNYEKFKFKRDLNDYIFVLDKINKAYDLKQRIGRRKIYEYAIEEKVFLTEQQIRSILLELQDFELVKVLSGRGGSIITEKGRKFLKQNES